MKHVALAIIFIIVLERLAGCAYFVMHYALPRQERIATNRTYHYAPSGRGYNSPSGRLVSSTSDP